MIKNRIAFISEHASPLALLGGVDSGGQNVYVDSVAKHLAKRGYVIDVFTRWDNPAFEEVIDYSPGIRVIHVCAGPKEFIPKEQLFEFMDAFTIEMIRFIQESAIHYELVHAHFWMSGYVAAQIKSILDIPFVITFHALGKVRRIYQGKSDGFPDSRMPVEELICKMADAIIAECPQDKEDMMVFYYVIEDKIKVIPCGFDQEEFYPMNRSKTKIFLGMDPKEPVILQLGRMVARKGVDNLIQSMAFLLQKKRQPARLLIVGGESEDPDPVKTPEIARLQEIAKEVNVLDRVTFIGRRNREQLKYYYNAADIFVSTPWYEPFGITPLEAMACGTPVIGSNVGGIKFSVVHGKTGFLVPPNEPQILAERIREILENTGKSKKFGVNAIKHVHATFTWELVAASMAGLYEKVAKNRTKSNGQVTFSFIELMNSFKNKVVNKI